MKIVVLLLTEDQQFQRMQAESARAAASQMGIDVDVVFAGSSQARQVQQISSCIDAPKDKRPAAMVVEPTSATGFEEIAKDSLRAGIGWIVLNASPFYIDYLSREFPGIPIACVASDDSGIGQIQGKQFRAILPHGGRALYIEGPAASSCAIRRRRAMEDELRGSRVTIGKILFGNWTEASAESVTAAWLSLKAAFSPDLIGAQNDSMAMGARKAILAQKPEWVRIPICGCDGLPEEGQRFVKEGSLTATIVTPVTAGKGVELAVRALRGESIPPATVVPVHSCPPIEKLGRG